MMRKLMWKRRDEMNQCLGCDGWRRMLPIESKRKKRKKEEAELGGGVGGAELTR